MTDKKTVTILAIDGAGFASSAYLAATLAPRAADVMLQERLEEANQLRDSHFAGLLTEPPKCITQDQPTRQQRRKAERDAKKGRRK